MRKRNRLAALGATVAALLTLAGCAGSPAAAPTTSGSTAMADYGTLRVVTTNTSLNYATFYLADANGYLKNAGFTDVQYSVVGTNKSVPALVGGSADIALATFSELLNYAQARTSSTPQLVALNQLYQGNAVTYVASTQFLQKMKEQGITPSSSLSKKVKALKGATIGISSPGSPADTLIRQLLTKEGVIDDVKIASLGTQDSIVAATGRGSIDLGAVVEPNTSALIQQKAAIWINPTKEVEGQDKLVYACLIVPQSKVSANKTEFVAMMSALKRAQEDLKTDRAGAMKKIQAFLPDIDPAVYKTSFDNSYASITAPLAITTTAADATIEAAKLQDKVTAKDVLDNSIVEQAK